MVSPPVADPSNQAARPTQELPPYSAVPSVSQHSYAPGSGGAPSRSVASNQQEPSRSYSAAPSASHGGRPNYSLNIEPEVSHSAHSANGQMVSSTMTVPGRSAAASHRYSSSQGAPAASMSQTARVTRPPPRGAAASQPNSRTPPPSPGLRPYA